MVDPTRGNVNREEGVLKKTRFLQSIPYVLFNVECCDFDGHAHMSQFFFKI